MAAAKKRAAGKSDGDAPATKPKKAKRKGPRGAAPCWLRVSSDPRGERRFKPSSSSTGLLALLLSSLGAVVAGAGCYAQFLRTLPHPWGVPLLAGGVVLFLAGFVIQTRVVPTVRVGDAGLAVERGEEIERLGWHEIDAIRFASGALTFSGAGKVVALSLGDHKDAAGLALAEARARIPARTAALASETIEAPPLAAGEPIKLEEAQVAGKRCHASGRIVSFERDARLCGRCGQVYHFEEVPSRCDTCDTELV